MEKYNSQNKKNLSEMRDFLYLSGGAEDLNDWSILSYLIENSEEIYENIINLEQSINSNL